MVKVKVKVLVSVSFGSAQIGHKIIANCLIKF